MYVDLKKKRLTISYELIVLDPLFYLLLYSVWLTIYSNGYFYQAKGQFVVASS